jgi:hypothetical protein
MELEGRVRTASGHLLDDLLSVFSLMRVTDRSIP